MSAPESNKNLRRQARERFNVARKLESEYLRALRQLTRQIDHMVKGMAPNGVVTNSQELEQMLRQYSQTIRPWAKSVAQKMIARIAQKDKSAWIQLGKAMGKALRQELNDAPTGAMLNDFLATQVQLITSLPLEAAERVHRLTQEAMISSSRASEVAKEILLTGKVTESRAKLIARTEVARTASALTLARSAHVGVTHYVWRTSGDAQVRESHKHMNGKVIPVDIPPEVEPGKAYHAGQFPNCRCWCSPIFPDD